MTTAASVEFERVRAEYVVPADHAEPASLRERLDRIVRDELPKRCARALPAVLPEEDGSVWLVPSLDVELAWDAVSGDATAADAWVDAVVEAFLRVLSGREGQAVRFADRAALVAAYVDARATGSSPAAWPASLAEPLEMLSAGAAVVAALEREPAVAAAALEQLAGDGRIERVLAVLTERERRRLSELLAAAREGSTSAFASARARVTAAAAGAPVHPAEADAATAGAAAAAETDGDDPALEDAVADVLAALRPPAHARVAAAHLLARLAVRGIEPRDAAARLGGDAAALWEAYLAHPGEETERALVELLAPPSAAAAADARRLLETMVVGVTQRLGVAALRSDAAALLRLALELRRAGVAVPRSAALVEAAHAVEVLVSLVAAEGADAAATAIAAPSRLVDSAQPARARALAPIRAAAAGDRAWSLRLALAATPAPATARPRSHGRDDTVLASPFGGVFLLLPLLEDLGVAAVAEEVDDAPAELLRSLVLLKCVGRPRAAAAAVDPVLALAAGAESVPQPADFAAPAHATLDDAVALALAARLAEDGRLEGRAVIFEEADGVVVAADAATDLWLYAAPAAGTPPLARLRDATGLPLERSDALRPYPSALDLEHVVAGPPLEPRFDLAWALAARNVLKAFGARLLGFGSSSVPHLWENALAGLTLVRVRGDVVEVELPRVPLDVVLRLSGVDGRTYTVPWLPDLEIRLRLPSE